MRITYDGSADAAYVHLVDQIRAGEAVRTHVADVPTVGTSVNLDFDAAGHLLGIEILGASHSLPTETIECAERLDRDD